MANKPLKKYKVANKYRSDIDFTTANYKKANLIRILQYEKIEYTIGERNKIFVNGVEKQLNDEEYAKAEEKYSKILPLWETEMKNAKKYEDLYNDKKWIIGRREQIRKHPKLLVFDNGFKLKVGFLWKHQPFTQRPTYNVGQNKKFVKMFYVYNEAGEVILEDENWGSILARTGQYIKDNARHFYDSYEKLMIRGYCKSEAKYFDIVQYDILETKWLLDWKSDRVYEQN